MADISLSNLDYSARSSYDNHDLDYEAPTPSACIDVDGELTRTLLPGSTRLPPDDDGEVSSKVEYLQNSSMSTFANETIRLRHRREAPEALAEHRESYQGVSSTYSNLSCAIYQNSSTAQALIYYDYSIQFPVKNCTYLDIRCSGIGLEVPKCRLNIRMSAGFTLTACLSIKAAYMISVTISARHRTKTHCLTFGDVIVASAVESDLQVHNECMVNAGDGHRHRFKHTCHK